MQEFYKMATGSHVGIYHSCSRAPKFDKDLKIGKSEIVDFQSTNCDGFEARRTVRGEGPKFEQWQKIRTPR